MTRLLLKTSAHSRRFCRESVSTAPDYPIPTSAFGLFLVPTAPITFNGFEHWALCHGRTRCLDRIGNVKRRRAGIPALRPDQNSWTGRHNGIYRCLDLLIGNLALVSSHSLERPNKEPAAWPRDSYGYLLHTSIGLPQISLHSPLSKARPGATEAAVPHRAL